MVTAILLNLVQFMLSKISGEYNALLETKKIPNTNITTEYKIYLTDYANKKININGGNTFTIPSGNSSNVTLNVKIINSSGQELFTKSYSGSNPNGYNMPVLLGTFNSTITTDNNTYISFKGTTTQTGTYTDFEGIKISYPLTKTGIKGEPRGLKTIGNKESITIFGKHIDNSRVTQD